MPTCPSRIGKFKGSRWSTIRISKEWNPRLQPKKHRLSLWVPKWERIQWAILKFIIKLIGGVLVDRAWISPSVMEAMKALLLSLWNLPLNKMLNKLACVGVKCPAKNHFAMGKPAKRNDSWWLLINKVLIFHTYIYQILTNLSLYSNVEKVISFGITYRVKKGELKNKVLQKYIMSLNFFEDNIKMNRISVFRIFFSLTPKKVISF